MSEFDCHSPLSDCIIEFACANGFNVCKKLNQIRPVRLHMACMGVGCVCGSAAENMGVCLFHFTQGSWVCASLYRRAANMSQSRALKPGYRLQGSKHHKSANTWISLSTSLKTRSYNRKQTRDRTYNPLSSSWPT